MKWSLAIVGIFVFFYFLVPPIYRAMKKHDYDNLAIGMENARVSGGSYHEEKGTYHSFSDKYVYGQ